jgi:hypothetical protein
MSNGRAWVAASLAVLLLACGDDEGGDADGSSTGTGGSGTCTDIAEMTASPTANATAASVGDVVNIVVSVNAVTTRVHTQLLSGVDGMGYGDGTADASGAGEVAVEVQIATGAPPGKLFPFIQVYECGSVTSATQYAPDLMTGAYLSYRPLEGGDPAPTDFVAPSITVE